MLFIDIERAKEQGSISKARHKLRKTLYQKEAVITVANYSKSNTKCLHRILRTNRDGKM